jgi:hypothetical protein
MTTIAPGRLLALALVAALVAPAVGRAEGPFVRERGEPSITGRRTAPDEAPVEPEEAEAAGDEPACEVLGRSSPYVLNPFSSRFEANPCYEGGVRLLRPPAGVRE